MWLDKIDVRYLIFIDELVGAMSDEGLIASMTLPGGLNTPIFMVDVEVILLPQLWKEAIIVMDNLPVHHAKTVES